MKSEQLKEAILAIQESRLGDLDELKIENEDVVIDRKLKKAIGIVLSYAQSYLSAASKELPGRKRTDCSGCDRTMCPKCGLTSKQVLKNMGFNTCLDEVTPIVARLREENEELRKGDVSINGQPSYALLKRRFNEIERKYNVLYSDMTNEESSLYTKLIRLRVKNMELQSENERLVEGHKEIKSK